MLKRFRYKNLTSKSCPIIIISQLLYNLIFELVSQVTNTVDATSQKSLFGHIIKSPWYNLVLMTTNNNYASSCLNVPYIF